MKEGDKQHDLEAGLVGKSSTLMLSTVVANGLSLIGYALLPRVYDVSLVGEFFAVIAIANVLSVFVHLGLVQAVPLMDDSDLKVGVTLLGSISLFVLMIGLVSSAVSGYMALVFLAAGVLSLVALVEVVLIREGQVGGIAVFRVTLPLFGFFSVLVFGSTYPGGLNLIVGSYLGGLSVTVFAASAILLFPLTISIDAVQIRRLGKDYSRFLRYIGPGLLFHTAAYNLPSVVGLTYFGGTAVAAYNLAYKFVLAPMTIVGKAISQAYISNLSSAYRRGATFSFAGKLDFALLSLALLAAAGIYFVFPWVALLIFPETHAEISAYANALIPLVAAMLTVSPLSNILQFTDNQKKIFRLHVVSFLMSLFAFGLAIYVGQFLVGVALFSSLILVRYLWLYREIVRVRGS